MSSDVLNARTLLFSFEKLDMKDAPSGFSPAQPPRSSWPWRSTAADSGPGGWPWASRTGSRRATAGSGTWGSPCGVGGGRAAASCAGKPHLEGKQKHIEMISILIFFFRVNNRSYNKYNSRTDDRPEEAVLGADDQDLAVVVLVLRLGVVIAIAPDPRAVLAEGLLLLARAQSIHLPQGGGLKVPTRRGGKAERAALHGRGASHRKALCSSSSSSSLQ